jgi:tetratricopeptide (TPR) repeat protein
VDSQLSSVNALIAAARQAEGDGRLETAASAWKEVRQCFPQNSDGFTLGGCVLKRLGQLSEAVTVFAQGLERFPKNEWLAVEHAWAHYNLGDFSKASECWRKIRELFPDKPVGYLGGGVASRRACAFNEADEVYRAALTRFPDSLPLFQDYAWSGEEQHDTSEAIRRWAIVRARFPEAEGGHVRSGVLLLNSGRWDEADTVLAETVRRFPDCIEALTSYAWVAHHRRDWPEALKRWDPVITRFPHLRDPRRLAAQALMELGRYDEARNVLAPALRMFPDDVDIAMLNGWLATRRRDLSEAERIWRSVRERYPDKVDGYMGYALALREVSRLDEAEAMLLEASKRFPENPTVAMDLAQIPERKQNWSLASRRWRDVVSRFPSLAGAYIGLGNSLHREGVVSEAEKVYREGLDRFPDNADMAAAEARLASRSSDWPKALDLWTTIQNRFPDNPAGPVGLGQALRDCGQLERSAEALSEAHQRFPANVEVEVQLALTLSAMREWPKALETWDSLKRRFPGNSDVRWGIAQILDKALSDQAAVTGAPFEIPASILAANTDDGEYVKTLAALFKRFESIGDTCEFGMVQRIFQADQVSLLRWAATSPGSLVTALNNRLEGVGDPEHTIIAINGDEYTTEDRRYLMHSHTFTSPSAEPYELFAPEQCRRLQWLREKFIGNLTAAAKIFVYKYEDGLTEADAEALHAALCNYCPDIAVLCVKLEEPGHPSGTVQQLRSGLFVGYIDKFSTVDISVSAWIAVCQSVVARLPPGANRAKVD